MKKREVAVLLILVLLTIVSIGTTLYAWFGFIEKTQPIIIYSGSIELNAELYELDSEEEITESLEYRYLVPGDSYSYQLELENAGTLNGDLIIEFDFTGTTVNLNNYVSLIIKTSLDDNNPEKIKISNMTNNKYKYYNTIDRLSSKTIYFEIEIDSSLEPQHLGEQNLVVLNKIHITLQQQI